MKKEKYKSIAGFFVFIIILSIVFSKVTWLFRGNGIEARTDLAGYKNQGNMDVVLYGGSTLLRFYSPLDAWNQSGMAAYNYATSAAKVDIVKEYIKDSRKTNDALLYVVDIRTFPLLIDQVDDKSLRNWSDSLPVFSPVRWQGISSFLFTRNWKEADIPSFYFDIIRYHSNTAGLADSVQWDFLDRSNIYNIDKGYAPNILAVPFETPSVCDERGELTEQQANALSDLLDYCDAENLPVLFIVCPYFISEEDWKTFNTCGDIIQSRGYDYVNFNNYYDDIGLDFETDFSDINHVNYLGSIKYTEYLTKYLISNYEIPDRRGESDYSQWNDDYSSFKVTEEQWYQDLTEMVSNHLEAKTTGQNLRIVDNFETWLQTIQNDNFTIIIKKNERIDVSEDNDALSLFASKYGVELAKDYYIGLWNLDNCLFSTNESDSADLNIGVDGGRGQDSCIITSGDKSQLRIDGVDYYNSDASIQIVVYDNNYKEVVDNVGITVDEAGNIIMSR